MEEGWKANPGLNNFLSKLIMPAANAIHGLNNRILMGYCSVDFLPKTLTCGSIKAVNFMAGKSVMGI
jgi:hypothetical protein